MHELCICVLSTSSFNYANHSQLCPLCRVFISAESRAQWDERMHSIHFHRLTPWCNLQQGRTHANCVISERRMERGIFSFGARWPLVRLYTTYILSNGFQADRPPRTLTTCPVQVSRELVCNFYIERNRSHTEFINLAALPVLDLDFIEKSNINYFKINFLRKVQQIIVVSVFVCKIYLLKNKLKAISINMG